VTPRDPYGYIKTKKIKTDNIHCERRFLYILGEPGPWCAAAIAGLPTFFFVAVNSSAQPKGQLISKGLFDVIVWTKKPTTFF
jgi:hypothetical protein